MTTRHAPASFLYQTIRSQPDVIASVLHDQADTTTRAAELIHAVDRVFLAGTGTSSHAAVVGEHLLRSAGADAYAMTNFDFATYPRKLSASDALIAISHRGSKRYGRAAIQHAREAGARVVGITGFDSPMSEVDLLIRTAPQEKSATHTASYTGNLTALAMIATELGRRAGADVADLAASVADLPKLVGSMLDCEKAVWPIAEALASRGRITLVGAGPNAVTAREGALKIKESSYLSAEGFELETLLHGGLQSIEVGDVAVAVATFGPALQRTQDAVRALSIIGAKLMIVADERVAQQVGASSDDTVIIYSAVPEALSPVLAVIPLQLLAALTAALRGTNADAFRADDPTYKQANESYSL